MFVFFFVFPLILPSDPVKTETSGVFLGWNRCWTRTWRSETWPSVNWGQRIGFFIFNFLISNSNPIIRVVKVWLPSVGRTCTDYQKNRGSCQHLKVQGTDTTSGYRRRWVHLKDRRTRSSPLRQSTNGRSLPEGLPGKRTENKRKSPHRLMNDVRIPVTVFVPRCKYECPVNVPTCTRVSLDRTVPAPIDSLGSSQSLLRTPKTGVRSPGVVSGVTWLFSFQLCIFSYVSLQSREDNPHPLRKVPLKKGPRTCGPEGTLAVHRTWHVEGVPHDPWLRHYRSSRRVEDGSLAGSEYLSYFIIVFVSMLGLLPLTVSLYILGLQDGSLPPGTDPLVVLRWQVRLWSPTLSLTSCRSTLAFLLVVDVSRTPLFRLYCFGPTLLAFRLRVRPPRGRPGTQSTTPRYAPPT